MSCTMASSDEPSVMTWVARSRSTQHAQYQRIAGTFAGGWIFRFQSRHVGDPFSGRNRRSAERRRERIQRRFDFAEHRDIAGIIEAKLTCRGRDLNQAQFARHCRSAIIGESIDLFADQQHRMIAAERLVDFLCGRGKLTAKIRMQRIDRALHMKWRSVDIRIERGRNAAHGFEVVRGADSVIGHDGELLCWNGL